MPPAGGALRARNHPTGGHQDLPPPVEAPPSGVQRIHCTPMGTATRHEVSPPVETPPAGGTSTSADHASPGSWALPQDHPLPTGGRWPFVLPCSLLWAPSSFAFALAPPASAPFAHPSRSHSRSAFLRLSLWGASRRAFLGAVSSGLGGALPLGWVGCLRVGCFLGGGWWVCGGCCASGRGWLLSMGWVCFAYVSSRPGASFVGGGSG